MYLMCFLLLSDVYDHLSMPCHFTVKFSTSLYIYKLFSSLLNHNTMQQVPYSAIDVYGSFAGVLCVQYSPENHEKLTVNNQK